MDPHRLISAKDLTKQFHRQVVLDHLDIDVLEGEILVIMGSSGAGKSVLLKHLAGLFKPDSGQILFKDMDLALMSEAALDKVRLHFGMVFQFGALFNSMTVEDNVGLALRYHKLHTEDEISAIVKDRLDEVGLLNAAGKLPGELSGGMVKRAALARALASEPEVIFYDEPTTGLDPVMCENIEKLIYETNQRRGVTSVVVTHDVALAFEIGSRVALLHKGKILAVDEPDKFRESEQTEVQYFLRRARRLEK